MVDAAGVDSVRDCRERSLLAEQHFGLFEGLTASNVETTYPRRRHTLKRPLTTMVAFGARPPMGESRFRRVAAYDDHD